MKFILYILASALTCSNVLAQQASLKGKFFENEKGPVSNINIKLSLESDSSKIFSSVSDSSGFFCFLRLEHGRYRIVANSITHKKFIQGGIIVNKDLDLGQINIVSNEQNLDEVIITSTQSSIQQKTDRMIVKVGSSLSSTGSSILEILERSPGVSNNGSSLSLRGRPGTTIMIDGKPQPLSGEDLIAFLKGMPGANVDQIELISSPPSNYDASGGAGIINIKTKRISDPGINGSLNANLIQGKYARQNAGFSLNRYKGKWNLQANYNFQNNTDFTSSDSFREFVFAEVTRNRFVQKNFFKTLAQVHIGQLSAEYMINQKMQIGITGRIYKNDNTRYLDNLNTEFNQSAELLAQVQTKGRSIYHRSNPALTLNYRYDLGKSRTLSADIDFANYATQNKQESNSTILSINPEIQNTLTGNLSGSLKLYLAKVDYQMSLKKLLDELSTGIKATEVNAQNFVSFNIPTGVGQQEGYSSNDNYLYDEQISAIYVSGRKKIKDLNFQLGVRFEHTYTKAQKSGENNKYSRQYGQVFPNLSIDYNFPKGHTVSFLVNSRIDRPTYKQLNPFRYYLNENTYVVGNPELMPQLATNIEVAHTINRKVTFRYMYSRTRGNMYTVLENDADEIGMVRMIDRNLDRTHYFGIGISMPISIGKWYTGYYDLNFFKNKFQGNLAGTDLSESGPGIMGSATNNFSISPSWAAEFSINYKGKRRDALQLLRSNFAAMVALQKSFMKKKMSLRLTVSDILYTNRSRFSTKSKLYNDKVDQLFDTRLATLGVSYRFGSNANAGKWKKAQNDELKQRAN